MHNTNITSSWISAQIHYSL